MVHDGANTDTIDIEKLQNMLMADDCWLPGKQRRIAVLSQRLHCNAPVVINGKERGDENKWIGKKGDFLEFYGDAPFHLHGIRLVLDSDLNRDYQNMPCCIRLHEERFRLPKTLLKDFDIVLTLSDGKTKTLALRDVHTRFLRLFADEEVTSVRLFPLATHGAETYNIFNFEVF